MFIGHINEIIKMLKIAEKHNLADSDDDQLFYTNLYLNENIRVHFYFKINFEYFF